LLAWKRFESDSCDFLKALIGGIAQVECLGSSDSTVPDIRVTPTKGKPFFVEAKLCPSQAGQFVVDPDFETGTVKFGDKNKTEENMYTSEILKFLSGNIRDLKDSRKPITEVLPNRPEVLSGWIMQYYREKDVAFFISNDMRIVPIDKVDYAFKVSAKCREKKSGSRRTPKKDFAPLSEFLKSEFGGSRVTRVRDKFVWLIESDLSGTVFKFGSSRYMFSGSGPFEIRKLGNTNNLNVIFSLELNEEIEYGHEAFLNYVAQKGI
jgi:hypothetical protein